MGFEFDAYMMLAVEVRVAFQSFTPGFACFNQSWAHSRMSDQSWDYWERHNWLSHLLGNNQNAPGRRQIKDQALEHFEILLREKKLATIKKAEQFAKPVVQVRMSANQAILWAFDFQATNEFHDTCTESIDSLRNARTTTLWLPSKMMIVSSTWWQTERLSLFTLDCKNRFCLLSIAQFQSNEDVLQGHKVMYRALGNECELFLKINCTKCTWLFTPSRSWPQ